MRTRETLRGLLKLHGTVHSSYPYARNFLLYWVSKVGRVNKLEGRMKVRGQMSERRLGCRRFCVSLFFCVIYIRHSFFRLKKLDGNVVRSERARAPDRNIASA